MVHGEKVILKMALNILLLGVTGIVFISLFHNMYVLPFIIKSWTVGYVFQHFHFR